MLHGFVFELLSGCSHNSVFFFLGLSSYNLFRWRHILDEYVRLNFWEIVGYCFERLWFNEVRAGRNDVVHLR